MKRLIVIHHLDENYDVGGLVRFLIKIFNDENYKKNLMDVYGIETTTSRDIYQKYHSNNVEYLNKASTSKSSDDIVVFGIHPFGIHIIETCANFLGQKIKKIGWTNDPHYFAYTVEQDSQKVKKYSKKIFPIKSLEILDYLVTPSSIYFDNLGIDEYRHKIIDIFYFLNTTLLSNLSDKKYEDRTPKIILSGAIGGYSSRSLFNELRENDVKFKNLIYKLNHPGRKNNGHMTEANYYNKLSEFKGGFVGHHDFPLNYLLAKHIEVLMCGCLGFFEPNPLLKSQLGLQEYIHYIPCYKDGKIIDDASFYGDWLKNGENIAKQGKEYVLREFGDKQIMKLFNFLNKV
jgi:hypothetical protein